MEEKSVWQTLSAINVNDHVEKKNGFSFLSWTWAWSTLKGLYPDASFHKHIHDNGLPYIKDDQGFAYVVVTVSAGGDSATETYPVLNYKNQSISNPNAFEVNTALQRGMVKAMAYLGLGFYIYAGEDLPADASVEQTNEQPKDEGYPKAQGYSKDVGSWGDVFNMFLELVEFPKNVDEINDLYLKNKKVLDDIQSRDEETYSEIIELFKKKKEALKG